MLQLLTCRETPDNTTGTQRQDSLEQVLQTEGNDDPAILLDTCVPQPRLAIEHISACKPGVIVQNKTTWFIIWLLASPYM
jgi:hypothetical protein